ncbi:hypothetical protein [Stenotrophomonas maltophilia]|uniref:hypothetical protein n=1 Tax=Stenotrophomonas maltophilia TaxID=40324 RepID=UPI0022F37EFB|nr:hypothetical protein [Stenotrophomonas maltophilia]MDA5344234.1 hypothetical protein [Stenotrophomonas maltophilia]
MSFPFRLLTLLLGCVPFMAGAAQPTAADTMEEGLRMPYDGHPLAMLLQPALEARYLPAGLDNEAAIRRAVADGVLREPIYPSLQLADDRAYVWLSQFRHSTLGMVQNTVTRCDGTAGFTLLLEDQDCAASSGPQLHFERVAEGELACRECGALQLPVRWLLQPAGAQCSLPGWDQAAAQRRFGDWWQRFNADMRPFLHDGSEALWKARVPSIGGSVVPRSRATATLFSLSVAPADFGSSIGVADAGDTRDLLPRLLALLEDAQVVGRGGIYPEHRPEFAALCAEVWYLRVREGNRADAAPVPVDVLERDGYPFITVVHEGDRIVLAGISRELAQRLLGVRALE